MTTRVVLSLFPGVGLLDRAFEEEGFIVVRGPDVLFGGDIRNFHPGRGWCFGVIGGPPCQDFSAARRSGVTGYGVTMLAEFVRVVEALQPAWWLAENVPRVPDIVVPHYVRQRFPIDLAWFTSVRRLRHVQFGSTSGVLLDPPLGLSRHGGTACVMASDDREFAELVELQGLPPTFDLPGFTVEAKKAAVGNGVPLAMGRVLARLVSSAFGDRRDSTWVAPVAAVRRCSCGCGRVVTRRLQYSGSSCRKRAERRRRRDSAATLYVTDQAGAA